MISIIVPTYNEKDNINILIEKVHDVLKDRKYEIIIIDDNSPDKTWKVAEYLKYKYPVKVIRRKEKKDLSLSVLEGLKNAAGEIFCVMDADLSHSPEDIPRLLKPIEKDNYDLVIGSRLIKGAKVEVWPYHRRIISIIGRFLARPLTDVKDIMSGFFMVKKEVIDDVNLRPRGYKICLEILVKGRYDTFKEVPIIFRNRRFGKSKMGLLTYLTFLYHLFSLYLFKIYFFFRGKNA